MNISIGVESLKCKNLKVIPKITFKFNKQELIAIHNNLKEVRFKYHITFRFLKLWKCLNVMFTNDDFIVVSKNIYQEYEKAWRVKNN